MTVAYILSELCADNQHELQEELREGDQLFIKRDRELAEMSSQLCTKCKRVEGVQERERLCQAK